MSRLISLDMSSSSPPNMLNTDSSDFLKAQALIGGAAIPTGSPLSNADYFNRSPIASMNSSGNRRSQQLRAYNAFTNQPNTIMDSRLIKDIPPSAQQGGVSQIEDKNRNSMDISMNSLLNESKNKPQQFKQQFKIFSPQNNIDMSSSSNQHFHFDNESLDSSNFQRSSFLKSSLQLAQNRLRLLDDKISETESIKVAKNQQQSSSPTHLKGTLSQSANHQQLIKHTSIMSEPGGGKGRVKFQQDSLHQIHLFDSEQILPDFLNKQSASAMKAIQRGLQHKTSLKIKESESSQQKSPAIRFSRGQRSPKATMFSQVVSNLNNNINTSPSNQQRRSNFSLSDQVIDLNKFEDGKLESANDVQQQEKKPRQQLPQQKSKFQQLKQPVVVVKRGRRVSPSKLFGNLTNNYEKDSYIRKLSFHRQQSLELMNSLRKNKQSTILASIISFLRYVKSYLTLLLSCILKLAFLRDSCLFKMQVSHSNQSQLVYRFSNIFFNVFSLGLILQSITEFPFSIESFTSLVPHSRFLFYSQTSIILLLAAQIVMNIHRSSDQFTLRPALQMLFNSNPIVGKEVSPRLSISILMKRYSLFEAVQECASEQRFNRIFLSAQVVYIICNLFLAFLSIQNINSCSISSSLILGAILSILIHSHGILSEKLFNYLEKNSLEKSESLLIKSIAFHSCSIFALFQITKLGIFSDELNLDDIHLGNEEQSSENATEAQIECVISSQFGFAFCLGFFKLFISLLDLFILKQSQIPKELLVQHSTEEENLKTKMVTLSNNEDITVLKKEGSPSKVYPAMPASPQFDMKSIDFQKENNSIGDLCLGKFDQNLETYNVCLAKKHLRLSSVSKLTWMVTFLEINSALFTLVFLSKTVFLIGIICNIVMIYMYSLEIRPSKFQLVHSFMSDNNLSAVLSQVAYLLVTIAICFDCIVCFSNSNNSSMPYEKSLIQTSAEFFFENDKVDSIYTIIFHPVLLLSVGIYLAALSFNRKHPATYRN